jgi:hypothetical protein
MSFHIKSVLIGEHIEGCGSVRCVKAGTWDSAWVIPKSEFVKSTIIGKKGRPTNISCIVFRCNYPECEAKLIVEEKEVISLLRKY